MKGRLTAMMPISTATSVYMISSGWSISPMPISEEFSAPRLPKAVIQPAARTALPTKSGSTTAITMRFLKRLWVRAST
ncbi:hypothetical protein D3C72_2473680 [compost metagenome]